MRESRKSWWQSFRAIGAGAAKATNPFGINSDLNPASAQGLTNLAGLSGMAPNENAVQFFSNIEFREFTFDFEIFTPSAADKAIAETLVKIFQAGYASICSSRNRRSEVSRRLYY